MVGDTDEMRGWGYGTFFKIGVRYKERRLGLEINEWDTITFTN